MSKWLKMIYRVKMDFVARVLCAVCVAKNLRSKLAFSDSTGCQVFFGIKLLGPAFPPLYIQDFFFAFFRFFFLFLDQLIQFTTY
jgi:hypothetical protein